jgi:hypothetical protein
VMLAAATFLGIALLAFAGTMVSAVEWLWPALLITWVFLGLGYSSVLTPTGRLLRRSARPEDWPAVFAAQFALSHACWLLTYPLAGWMVGTAGLPATLLVLGSLTSLGAVAAAAVWPAHDPEVVEHTHPELYPDHPHLREHGMEARHAHLFVIDPLHPRWPERSISAAGGYPRAR